MFSFQNMRLKIMNKKEGCIFVVQVNFQRFPNMPQEMREKKNLNQRGRKYEKKCQQKEI